MEYLVCMGSVRPSLFGSDKTREAYLTDLIHGTQAIMAGRLGLNHPDRFHEFCRLIARYRYALQT